MAEAQLDIVVRTQEAAEAVRRLREEMQQLGFQAKDTAEKTERSVASPSLLGRLKSLDSQFGAIRATLVGFGGLAVAGTLKAIADSAIAAGREMDGLATTADRLGLSIEGLQELRFAATLEDVDPEQLTLGLQRLSIAIGEAAQGDERAQETFAALGVSIRDVNANLRPTEAVLRDVADALAATEDPQRRLALGAELFTARGLGMLNILKGGAQGLDEFSRRARDAGAVIDGELVRNTAETADQFDAATTVLKTQFQAAVVGALPLITSLAQAMADAAAATGDLINRFRDAQNLSTTSLRQQIDELDSKIAAMEGEGRFGRDFSAELVAARRRRAELAAERDARTSREFSELFGGRPGPFPAPSATVGTLPVDPEELRKIAERQAELNTQIEREIELLRADGELARDLIEARHRLADAQLEAAGNTELLANAQERYRLEVAAANDAAIERAAEKRNELLEEGRRLYEAILTPLEIYQRTLAEIAELEGERALTPEQAERLRERAREDNVERIRSETDQRSRPETLEDELLAQAADEYAAAIERVTDALQAQEISQDEANQQLDQAAERYLDLKDAAREAQEEQDRFREALDRTQDALAGGLQQVFTDLITGSKDAGEAFKEFAARAVAAVLELIFQMTVLRSLQDSLGGGGGGSGGGGILGSLLGAFVGGLFGGGGGTGIQAGGHGGGSGLFGGAAAEGGLVLPRPGGVPILTAEAGSAELLLPLQDPRAMRMLRDSLGGGSAGAITVNISNQGAPLTVESTRSRVTENGLELEVAVRNVLLDDLGRGGQVDRAIARRFRALPPRSQV